jgi:hypothetical protein
MRTFVVAVAVMLALQGGVPRRDSTRPPAARDSLKTQLARRCVQTAPMPIAGFRSRSPEAMRVIRPDSTRDSAMVIRVVPCYLVDSLPRRAP